MTDIDGTISRIAARPDEATVSQSARDSLRSISEKLALVAVVTAREEQVARSMVGLDSLAYIGNYALHEGIDLGQGLEQAKSQVQSQLIDLPCVELEEKGISFALHYRNCEEEGIRERVLGLVLPVATEAGARVIEGKRVVELVPAGLPDKGTAVAGLLRERGVRGIVFIGDDFSDVAVFREITRRREEEGLPGLGIAVVDAETDGAVREAADEELAGVEEVEEFLAALAGVIGKGGDRDL
jgi:trehalose 6-phosphate phosphatase